MSIELLPNAKVVSPPEFLTRYSIQQLCSALALEDLESLERLLVDAADDKGTNKSKQALLRDVAGEVQHELNQRES